MCGLAVHHVPPGVVAKFAGVWFGIRRGGDVVGEEGGEDEGVEPSAVGEWWWWRGGGGG